MPLDPTAQLVLSVFSILFGAGVLFEIGRRFGRANVERNFNETTVTKLEQRLNKKFSELESRLDENTRHRIRANRQMVAWLGEITDALQDEGYDVERPETVREEITFMNGGEGED